MKSKLVFLNVVLGLLFIINLCGSSAAAQNARKSVGAAEVNGTFRYNFTGPYRGSSNEIKILALGGGKLKMQFDLIYPYKTMNGEFMANTGQDLGTAEIKGDTALFTSDETPECRIEVKFVRPGRIKVTHKSPVSSCGYGLNVWAQGTYRKTSGRKPDIRANL